MPEPAVAIVILNWNGRGFLEQFLPSVKQSTYSNKRIIVADNASTDDSLTFLKAHHPDVEVILLKGNFGFAKGYNEALKNVRTDYFLLLNSDVEVTPSWIEPMIQLLEADYSNAACQPKILSYHQKDLFEYAGACGGWIDAYGYPFARGRVFEHCEKDEGQYDTPQQVFWASGAALLIKAKYFNEAGGFDENFFAHQEEIDLCWRLQLQGLRIWCCPQSIVYHVGGGTLQKGHHHKTFLNFRNNLMMLYKNLPAKESGWKIPLRLMLDWVAATKGIIGGETRNAQTILKAHAAFFKWRAAQKQRSKQSMGFLKSLTGVYNGSVVWQYFVCKRKKFSEFVSKKEV